MCAVIAQLITRISYKYQQSVHLNVLCYVKAQNSVKWQRLSFVVFPHSSYAAFK